MGRFATTLTNVQIGCIIAITMQNAQIIHQVLNASAIQDLDLISYFRKFLHRSIPRKVILEMEQSVVTSMNAQILLMTATNTLFARMFRPTLSAVASQEQGHIFYNL